MTTILKSRNRYFERESGMKVKKATTQPGLFGMTLYFDTCGNKIGEARPHGMFERIDYYDSHDNFKGYSEKTPLGRRIYYDAQGNKTGTSELGLLESIIYYDNSGRKTGVSEKAPLGGTTYYEIK